MDFDALEQLLTFYKTGTLSESAERLHVSQSTLTRTMQKLEREIGVQLFTRTKNSIMFNEAGRLAAEHAELVIRQKEDLLYRVRDFDRRSRTIAIGSCAPAPLAKILELVCARFPAVTIVSNLGRLAELQEALETDICQLIILPAEPAREDWTAKQIGEEHLMFHLPAGHRYAKEKELSFAQMNGENFLLFQDIGFWRELVDEKLPDSHFLVQTEQFTFEELISHTMLPGFASDITLRTKPPSSRVAVPIADPEAHVTYYLVCKKDNRRRFAALFT